VSLPFFSDEKVVILDYFADLTTYKKRHLTDDELKQFEAYLENPVETTRFVILAPGKLDIKRRLVKLLKRDGLVLEANPLKEM
ncbi:DNA polymerase III subunit delta, partial [Streptococcus suis]|nr:DNA polymerase III subunit delta [Streptococcus suis]